MNREPKQTQPESRIDRINGIKKAAFLVASAAEAMRGEDSDAITPEQSIRLQATLGELNLAVTGLRLQTSPHIKRRSNPTDVHIVATEVVDTQAEQPGEQLSA